jgi:Na+/proline symporter
MDFNALDWTIVALYFLVALAIGLAFSRRAGANLTEYFVSGRNLPWWIAGTSMVATTFAADTPLAVTGLIAKNGLAGNWFWWAYAAGGMLTVFVFARLWRRAEVLTDVELVELRYSGAAASALRGTRALYIALIVNPIIIGWVTNAMVTILKETVLKDPELSALAASSAGSALDWYIILGCLLIVGIYSTVSGMWGVAVTDAVQFVLAMTGCIALAYFAASSVGGMHALENQLITGFDDGQQLLRFLPDFNAENAWMPLHIFMIIFCVQWWATWYPGAEPGGGGYVVQRMASCRDEKHAQYATLWYQFAHYCLRPWPWLVVAFVALATYPELVKHKDPGVGYAWIMRDVSPHGLRGLLLATFFAAFMSTISTQVNWGASYLMRDVYQRFLRPNASDRELTTASRRVSILVLVLGAAAAWMMRGVSVDDAWKMLAALGAGTGAVFMLRWFWWRINAWTEISAMVASLVFYLVFQQLKYFEKEEETMLAVAGATIVSWLLVTFMTPPETEVTLTSFYRKVRPDGPGWKPIARLCPEVKTDGQLIWQIIAAGLGAAVVYSTIPAVGLVLFGKHQQAAVQITIALISGVAMLVVMRRFHQVREAN